MSKYCPKCDLEFDDQLSNCPKCSAYITFDGQVIELDTKKEEVITEVDDGYQQINTEELLARLGPNFQKHFTYLRLYFLPKILAGTAIFFFSSPVTILLSLYSIFACIKLIKDYPEVDG
ncbi:MAG: hypothetical protein LBM99_04690, partial [Bacillales bacterium]|nr:hypothetical protein [Bacillales bacterium]